MKFIKVSRRLVGALLVAGLMTACGGGSDSGSGASVTGVATPENVSVVTAK